MVTRNRINIWGLGFAALAAGWPVAGVVPAGAQTVPAVEEADSLRAGDVPADLVEVAGELDAADQPLPAVTWAPEPGATGAKRPGGLGSGRVRWRTQANGLGTRHDGRWEWTAGPVGGRGVLRLRPGSEADVGGGAWVKVGPGRLWGGQLTLRHGFGLVASDPARRTSLTSDQGLGGTSGGVGIRTVATTAGRALEAGLELGSRSWRLSTLWQPATAGGTVAARAGHTGAGGELAFLAQRDSLQVAASCSGRWVRPSLQFHWEVAHSDPVAGRSCNAAIAGFSWQAARDLRLECQSGLADGNWTNPAAVLPAGARTGWAVRAVWRDRGAGSCDFLLQGARTQPQLSSASRRAVRVAEMSWSARPRPGLQVSLRLRRSERLETAWSERQPWEPAVEAPTGIRTLASAAAAWDIGRTKVAAQWRSFTVDAPTSRGSRQLATISWRRDFSRGLAGWVESASAWGDAVDLAQGVSPLPGLVVARHWGGWRSEILAGLSVDHGPVRLRAAAANRRPEKAPKPGGESAQAVWEGWLEAGAVW